MSFILDALRKSDQQRQRSATPTLATSQAAAAEPGQPALLWYGLIAAVLLGAGILIGWLHQAPSETVTVSIAPSLSKPVETGPLQVIPALLPAVAESTRKAEAPQRGAPMPAPGVMPPSVMEAKTPIAAAPPLPGPAAAQSAPREIAAAKPVEPGNPAAGDAAREPAVMQQSELPAAIRQEIPKLSILAHSYSSKPKARFVFINDRMMHEEDYPVPGLRLEQITPEGMVFSYKGYRFRRAANDNFQ